MGDVGCKNPWNSAPFAGGREKTRINLELLWDIPQKTASYLDFRDPQGSCNVRPMFQTANRPGWIEVISGVMFSGKSEELIRRVRRAVIARKKVQVFKSHLDARYAGLFSVSSHDGVTVEAEPVDSSAEISRRLREGTEVVAVDEAQFLDDGIIELSNRLADDGIRVILAGTDVDFRGEPFGPMPTLMCIAEIVDKFQAICVVCGGPATRNQRLVNGKPALWDSPIIMVGGRESYEARCRHCHRVPRQDEDQTALL